METTRDHRWAELREDALAPQKARGSAKMTETASDHLSDSVRDRWKVQTSGQTRANHWARSMATCWDDQMVSDLAGHLDALTAFD